MEYKYTVENIKSSTGLGYDFILKCTRELPYFFDKNTSRAEKSNQLLLNDNAFTAFDKIAQMKNDGKGLKSIKEYFKEHFMENNKSQQQEHQKPVKDGQGNNGFSEWRIDFKDFYQDMIKAKDEVIKAKESEVQALKSSIQLLLPEGKTAQEARAEQQKKDEELLRLQYSLQDKDRQIEERKREVEDLKVRQEEVREIKNLMENKKDELGRLKTQAEIAMKEKEEVQVIIAQKDEELELIRGREEKRQELLNKLQSLQGKWLAGGKRAKILQELQQLS